MKLATIMTALMTQLKAATSLSFIDDLMIMNGYRESVVNYPCLFLEPLGNKEEDFAYPKERCTFRVALMGYLHVNDKDKQIVGDSTTRGIIDFENDIKLAIDTDRTIGGTCIHADIVESTYEFEKYPVRGVTVVVDILFEQVKGTRT